MQHDNYVILSYLLGFTAQGCRTPGPDSNSEYYNAMTSLNDVLAPPYSRLDIQ